MPRSLAVDSTYARAPYSKPKRTTSLFYRHILAPRNQSSKRTCPTTPHRALLGIGLRSDRRSIRSNERTPPRHRGFPWAQEVHRRFRWAEDRRRTPRAVLSRFRRSVVYCPECPPGPDMDLVEEATITQRPTLPALSTLPTTAARSPNRAVQLVLCFRTRRHNSSTCADWVAVSRVAREVLRAYHAPLSKVGTACRSPDTAHTVVAGNAEMREINIYGFSAACGFMQRATGCPFPLGSFFFV
jgi:hypothetical protein